jgi:hypothetical protein
MTRPGDDSIETVALDFPASVEPATEFRSTWVVSSLEGLRAHGHFDRYQALLRSHHDEVLNCVAGAWLPMKAVRAHYAACEALSLSTEEVARMSREGGAVRRAWHSNIIAAAQRPGAEIWGILKQLHKLWLRGSNGGAAAVFQLGPKRARVEYVGCELFDIPYFRDAVGAVLLILGSHLCPTLRVTPFEGGQPGSARYILDWT